MYNHYIVKNGKVVGFSYLSSVVEAPYYVFSEEEGIEIGDLYDPVTGLFSKPQEVTDVQD